MTSRIDSDTGPFSVVPEWVIDSQASNGAFRLYAVLGRYANSDNDAWPSRATLARRLDASKDSIDRWIKELVGVGALRVTRRWSAERQSNQSNMYRVVHVRPTQAASTQPPSRMGAATPSRVDAAQNENQSEREPENEALSSEMDEARKLCEYLCDTMEVEAQITKRWIVDMERLVRIDGRTPDQVRRCIDWVAADEFWYVNVRSPQKLRKHWERLRLEAKRPGRSKGSKRKQVLRLLEGGQDTG
jgi:hypothetical protein